MTDAHTLFEEAGEHDSAGREEEAEPLYRRALAEGLAEPYRSQAVIQLASTIRNLGRPDETLELLRDLLAEHPDHELADAAHAFAALALFDQGLNAEALRETLTALARHLPLYQRSVIAYAAELEDL